MRRRLIPTGLLAAALALAAAPAVAVDGTVRTTSSDVYSPKIVFIKPGERVTFTQLGTEGVHNVVFVRNTRPPIPGPASTMDPWSDSRTFPAKGVYRFFCAEHGSSDGVTFGMVGAVIVNDTGTRPLRPVVSAQSVRVFRRVATLRFRSTADGRFEGTVFRRVGRSNVFTRFSAVTYRPDVRGNGRFTSIRIARPVVGRTLPAGSYRVDVRVKDVLNQRSVLRRVRFTIPAP